MPYSPNAVKWFESGSTLMQRGLHDEALQAFQDAVHADPALAEAWYNMGIIHQNSARLPTAIEHYRKALALKNDFAAAQYNLAHALDEQGRFEEAVQAYAQTLRTDPANARASYNLATLLMSHGRLDEAAHYFEHAIHISPDYAEALNNLGVVRRDQDRLDEARRLFDKVLAIDPRMPQALYNVGVCLQKSGDYAGGIEYYRQALAVDATYSPARWLHDLSLPMLYDSADEIAAARRRFARNLTRLVTETPLATPQEQRRALAGIACTTNFFLQYQGGDDRELQTLYGRFVSRVMAANFPRFSQNRIPPPLTAEGRIRVGYVSSFMRSHTVGIFLRGWLESHDHSRFELFGYHMGTKSDAETERIAAHLDHFHTFGRDLARAAERISEDRLHVLIYTDIGMDPITLQLAGLRLAPVQCKGWGHPVTTGLPTIDYYLSSDAMEAADAENHYSESLVRLPGLALNYTPPVLPAAPRSRRDLDLPEKAFIFLSSQSLFKYLPQFDAIYPAIALKVPQACFVFIEHSGKHVTYRFRERLRRAFAAEGLSADTFCRIVPRQDHTGFISLNLAADVLLDTFGWSGGKTTLEAIACGLPIVTCPGRFMRGRHAYAMLNIMQILQTIARDMDEYCAIAVRLAGDELYRNQIRSAIAQRRARLFEDRDFMIALESFLARKVETMITPQSHKESIPSQQSSTEEESYRTLLRERLDCRTAYNLGTLLLDTGRPQEACDMLKEAVHLAPAWAPAQNNLGKAYEALGKLKQPWNAFSKASISTQTLRWPSSIWRNAWHAMAERTRRSYFIKKPSPPIRT
jgi:protein O-GlcNAc transferase